MEDYIVYVLPDADGRIKAIDSSAFLPDPVPEGWVEIDRGTGDRYHHAQGNYLPGPIVDERGVYRYALAKDGAGNAAPVERSAQDMDADAQAMDAAEPVNEMDMLLELAADHEYRLCLIELGVNESDMEGGAEDDVFAV